MKTASVLDLAAQHLDTVLEAHRENASAKKVMVGREWRNHYSTSMGCHPTEVSERNQYLKEKGVTGASFLPDGRLEFRSREGMLKTAKAFHKANFDEVR